MWYYSNNVVWLQVRTFSEKIISFIDQSNSEMKLNTKPQQWKPYTINKYKKILQPFPKSLR